MPASNAAVPARRPWRIGHHAKRWLYIVHRWVGIGSCILFAMWFLSGLVMVYVPYPALTDGERLAGLSPIAWDAVRVQPDAAARAAGIADPERSVLEMRGARPVWRVQSWEGERASVSAGTGIPLPPASAQEAAATAAAFGHARPIAVELLRRDQWTVAGGYNRDRPLWKVSLGGPGGHVLYVSSVSGAVVLDTNARERFWNWLGSVPHWIYPTVLRQDNAVWRQVVMWVSFPCIVGGITGLWIGILRTRLGARRFKGDRIIPYHGWMAWHHVAGMVGGVALIAWIFSGWLSVDPFRLFASPGVSQAARQAYAGGGAPPDIDLQALGRVAGGARRIEVEWAAGLPLVTIEAPGGPGQLLDARTLSPAHLDQRALVAAGRRLLPTVPLRSVELLAAPDAYWYEVGEEPTLPMLRLRFGDRAGSWIHLDPNTGRFIGKLDRRRRVYRWAFDFLHKWDLNGLTLHRPLWDLVLGLLSILGMTTSVTGIWIGWRRLTCRRQPAFPVRTRSASIHSL